EGENRLELPLAQWHLGEGGITFQKIGDDQFAADPQKLQQHHRPNPGAVASGRAVKHQRIHLALGQQLEERLPAVAEFGDDDEMLMARWRFDLVKPIVAKPSIANRDMLPSYAGFQELRARRAEMPYFKLTL